MPPGLNPYEVRIIALERLLRVTEKDLLSAEGERDALASQLSVSQGQLNTLGRELLCLQLLRNQLVLDRLDAGEAREELAHRNDVLAEELQRQDKILRKIREENRSLRRKNEWLRIQLGFAEESGYDGGASHSGTSRMSSRQTTRELKSSIRDVDVQSLSEYTPSYTPSSPLPLIVWIEDEPQTPMQSPPPSRHPYPPPSSVVSTQPTTSADTSHLHPPSEASTPRPSNRTTFGGPFSASPPPLPSFPTSMRHSETTQSCREQIKPNSASGGDNPRAANRKQASQVWNSSLWEDEEADFTLIDPDHIALIEVSDLGH